MPQVTFQQICKDVHLVKHQGQQVFIESRTRPLTRPRVPSELARLPVRSKIWVPCDLRPQPSGILLSFLYNYRCGQG